MSAPAEPPRIAGRYINLARSPDRDAFMQAQLAQRGMAWVQRHVAVDGAQVPLPAGCKLLPGEYGCFLSHQQVLREAPADTHLLVLEDDAELSLQLPQLLAQIVASRVDADIVMLECQPHFSLQHLAPLWESASRHLQVAEDGTRSVTGIDLLEGARFFKWGCTAYLVTPAGRERFLALIQSWLDAGPVTPIDRCMEAAFAGGQLRAFITVPFLATVGVQWHGRSTVGNGWRVPPDTLMVLRRLLYAGPIGEVQAMAQRMADMPSDPALEMFALVLRDVAALHRNEARRVGAGAQAGG